MLAKLFLPSYYFKKCTARGCFSFATLGLIWLLLLGPAFSWSAQGDLKIEELLEKSHDAYRSIVPFEVEFKTVVSFPGADPCKKTLHYKFGKENQALIEISTLIRIVTSKDKLLMEKKSVTDRYLEIPYNGNLSQTLALVRGRSSLAGLWEPPQAVLKESSSVRALAKALRFSNRLGELKITGPVKISNTFYELTLKAFNGRCRARFNSFSYLLEEVEYLVRPAKGPKDYFMKIEGIYTTTPLVNTKGLFSFNPGERRKVGTLRGLSAPAPGIKEPPETVLTPQALKKNLITVKDLGKKLQEKRVLLIGEDHLYHEPPLYLCRLIEVMEKKPTHLLLELPHNIQPEIDAYMREGSESALKAIFSGRQVLQLQSLLRWAFKNRKQIKEVSAIDEPLYEIMLRRSYLEDTRNATLAAAIVRTWEKHPKHRIIVYAGQLHMMRAGRYRVDRPSRDTAGSRLTGLGIPANQIVSVMLNGGENFHLHSIWDQPGVLPLKDKDFRIPIPYLIDYPIFGAKYADEFFDYFVNLGVLTKVELE